MSSVQPGWDKMSGKIESVKSECIHVTNKAKVHNNGWMMKKMFQ
jgi:hypothetical protein